MLTRRDTMRGVLRLGALCAAAAGPAFAADTSPRAFVTAIYDHYKGKDGGGVQFDTDRDVQRYFEPSLGALIRKDQKAAARRNEVGALDFDPFVDSQDWDIAAFDVAVSDTGPGKATATVKFTSAGESKTVVLDLVKIKNDWRISNITWVREDKSETLRDLFAQ